MTELEREGRRLAAIENRIMRPGAAILVLGMVFHQPVIAALGMILAASGLYLLPKGDDIEALGRGDRWGNRFVVAACVLLVAGSVGVIITSLITTA